MTPSDSHLLFGQSYSVWKACNRISNCWRRSSSSLVISDRAVSGMWGRSSFTYSSSKSANAHLSAENTLHVYRFSLQFSVSSATWSWRRERLESNVHAPFTRKELVPQGQQTFRAQTGSQVCENHRRRFPDGIGSSHPSRD